MNKHSMFMAGAFFFCFVCAGENLLTNSSFEETVPYKKSRYKVELVKDWICQMNNGSDICNISLASPGASGKYALRLSSKGKGFNSAFYAKNIPVSAGDEVTATVKLRGRGQGFFRIWFLNRQGKRLGSQWNKHYRMHGMPAGKDWKTLVMKITVPDKAARIQLCLETLGKDDDVQFDDVSLEIRSGDRLENGKLKVTFNPQVGGGIDSLVWKDKNFDFTAANQITRSGGLFQVILPSKAMPGELLRQTFRQSASGPAMREYSAAVTAGVLRGLEVRKKYELLPDGVKFVLTLKNTSEKDLKIDQRIQNFVSSAPGTYSWPTPDWITVFHQTGAPLNGFNTVIQDLYRAGWQAKKYDEVQAVLLFEFDPADTGRLYAFFRMAPSTSTVEWFHKPFTLQPGAKRDLVSKVTVLSSQEQFYADAHGKKQKSYELKPVKMPEIPLQEELPARLRSFFPYSTGLGNLSEPEMVGLHKPIGVSRQYVIQNRRLMRHLVNHYFNAFETTIWGERHKLFRDEDGRHIQGEMARQYHVKLFLSTLFVYKKDVDVEKYMKNDWPRMKEIMTHPELQKFIREYQDVIPLIFTGDELLPQNAAVMLRVHQELRGLLPKHIVAFPYLNSSTVDLMPYVPVYLGDWYPIKRKNASGHNPWSVYKEFSRLVKLAGSKPVWFVPQGFAGGPDNSHVVYALPTAGEYRLMLHLAAAAGVKGIFWHGFPNWNWPWMMNYNLYRYAPMGGAGQLIPSWQGISDAGRTFATVGPLLLKAQPAALPEGVSVQCGTYRSDNRFYDGSAIRLFALKTREGTLLLAVNQNPYGKERGSLTLPEGKNFNLSALSDVRGRKLTLELAPGDAVYIYNGPEGPELDSAFLSRYQAERSRYLLLARQAAGDGIPVLKPDRQTSPSRSPRQQLEKLLSDFASLRKRVEISPQGGVIRELNRIRRGIDETDFLLCRALEAAVTPEMRKKTKRYARWCAHPDPEFSRLREELAALMADYYRIRDGLEEGGGSAAAAKALPGLRKRAERIIPAVRGWVRKQPDKIDNPFQ